ncbi:hypothetical protein [Hydrocoleum sp. CS-953]|uniref:hypothetical protein n=1 Tax=Microcoleaceae TaxID=1892252 RepID=UPI001FEE1057|nr:hypothetical protein [Hydrocoleum sp. CS-953]
MMKIGEILIRRDLISQAQLDQAIDVQASCRQKLGELLMFQGWIQQDDLEMALREQYWRQNGYWVID